MKYLGNKIFAIKNHQNLYPALVQLMINRYYVFNDEALRQFHRFKLTECNFISHQV